MLAKRAAHLSRPLWALSMGDLMTLILSFFLSIIASSLQQASNRPQVGTPIALTTIESEAAPDWTELKLESDSFDLSQITLKTQARKLLETKVKALKNDISEVIIRGCLEEGTDEVSDPWFVSIGRVVAVARQVIDTGLPQEAVRAEPASACSSGVLIDFVAINHG